MVSFNKIWTNHPGRLSSPCKFVNQCAIRMGIALQESGIDMSTFSGAKCWHGHRPKHILRAQELADWITINSRYFGDRKVYKNVTSIDFQGKKGIVFIKDGWGATDHIDIWDGSIMKGGATDYFEKGKEVWFWDLN
jgi:hypothetical protein